MFDSLNFHLILPNSDFLIPTNFLIRLNTFPCTLKLNFNLLHILLSKFFLLLNVCNHILNFFYFTIEFQYFFIFLFCFHQEKGFFILK